MSTIVIGVDESTRSEDAIAFTGRLAGATTADVLVTCAFPDSDLPGHAARRDELERNAAETARRMSERLTGIPPERIKATAIADRSAARALHTLAEAESAAIVVVGSTHTGTLGRVLPGATGERLLHGAPCAVAVVPDGYRNTPAAAIHTIGVAYDGSKEATTAAGAAAALSRALGARLELIGVLAPDPAYGAGELMGGSADPAMRELLRDNLRSQLDAAITALPEGVDASRVLLDGEPAEQLIERTADLGILVVGSRGYGPLRAVLVGGVSGRLVRAAQCPVVVTPRGVEAPLRGLS